MNQRHWHPVLIRSVCEILRKIFEEGKHADKAIEGAFKNNKQWGKRDRRFIAETVYDMVRYWRLLEFYFDKTRLDLDPYLIRWALYEVWKFDVDPTDLLKSKFKVIEPLSIQDLKSVVAIVPEDDGIALSFPAWLVSELKKEYGSQAGSLMKALNEAAPVCLRANTTKIDRLGLQKAMKEEGIETVLLDRAPDGLRLVERANVFVTKAFKDGLFEVQDEASQLVSLLVNPLPTDRVADACAGAGGKTLHLAALMKNKGTVLASDVLEWKIEELRKRAKRDQLSNIRFQCVQNSKDLKKHNEKFEKVLIDAPCSGTGVLRRNPDTKWKLNREELDRLLNLQKEILDTYCKWVKPGGRLVYATCSVLKSENEMQVQAFIKRNELFSLDGPPLITRPDIDQMDGFFAQAFTRKK